MVKKNFPVEKIEDALWRLKCYYDGKARFFSNMVHDIQFAVERMDNQQFEPNDFIDTSSEEQQQLEMMIASKPVAVPAKTNNNIDSDERRAVGTKRKYQEMAMTQQQEKNNELSSNSSIEISKQRQNMMIVVPGKQTENIEEELASNFSDLLANRQKSMLNKINNLRQSE